MTGVPPREYATNVPLSHRWLVAAECRLTTAPPIIPRLLYSLLQPACPGCPTSVGHIIGVATLAVFSCCTF